MRSSFYLVFIGTNKDLAKQYAKQHDYSMDMVYNTMEEIIVILDAAIKSVKAKNSST